MHRVPNFEVMPEADKALLTFHAEDAPASLEKSVLHRRTLRHTSLVFEGMGPDGAFEIAFGPMSDSLAERLDKIGQWTVVGLHQHGVAYSLELHAA